MLVIAHRGASKKAPENSLEAFQVAFEEGAQRIETDLQICHDHKLYLCHDDSTQRTTSSHLLISKTPSSELSHIHLENGETLPSLYEALKLLEPLLSKSFTLNLEIKTQDLRWISSLQDLLKTADFKHLRPYLILSSFHLENLTAMISSPLEDLQRALLWPPLPHSSVFTAPYSQDINPSQEFQSIIQALKKCQTHILHPEAHYWSELPLSLIHQAAAENLEIYTWSPFYYEELTTERTLWEKLLQRQVSGHATNYPLELRAFLRQKTIERY